MTGRIDGIYTDEAGRTVIEEVKTIVGTRADLEAVDAHTYPAYTRQLQLYRFLLEEGSQGLEFGGGAPEIALHLHLIALPGREERTVALDYDRAECRRHVHERLEALVAAEQATQGVRAERRARQAQVRFPHQEPRPHQDAMIEAIEEALAGPGRVLVSAPPGIGKTAGALVPALRHAQVTVYLHHDLSKRLPAPFWNHLRSHFLPLNQQLWLYGRRFATDDGRDAGTRGGGEFFAVKEGVYFVSPPEALGGDQVLRIGGRPVEAPIIHLARGTHRVDYEGSA